MKQRPKRKHLLNPKSARCLVFFILLIFSAQNIIAARVSAENDKTTQNIDKPNLLFIMNDQQRFDAMSCAGNLTINTPNISYATFNTEQILNALAPMKDGLFTLICSFDPPHPPMVIKEPYKAGNLK